jgi:hypothetical protein
MEKAFVKPLSYHPQGGLGSCSAELMRPLISNEAVLPL